MIMTATYFDKRNGKRFLILFLVCDILNVAINDVGSPDRKLCCFFLYTMYVIEEKLIFSFIVLIT